MYIRAYLDIPGTIFRWILAKDVFGSVNEVHPYPAEFWWAYRTNRSVGYTGVRSRGAERERSVGC